MTGRRVRFSTVHQIVKVSAKSFGKEMSSLFSEHQFLLPICNHLWSFTSRQEFACFHVTVPDQQLWTRKLQTSLVRSQI